MIKEIKYTTKTYSLKVAESESESLTTPDAVFDILKEDYNPLQEELYCLILNIKNKVIEKHLVCKGTHNALYIQPVDVIRPVLLTNGSRILLAHNHPSGEVSPSEDDIAFTRKIEQACKLMGIELLDHVVYSDNEYYSFKKQGIL
jgi:DNA repair protein RadC